MKPCVLYVSHTGNTKRLAEAIAGMLNAPLLNAVTANTSDVDEFDFLVIGTPIIGLKPAPELLFFVNALPAVESKRAILFSTYAFAQGGALKFLAERLGAKGYFVILSVGKRGVKPGKTDFQDILTKIGQAIKKWVR
jgi:flavodoxin